ncbi:hypothetical protein K3495_g1760 [Podosphaera aphanis]|nr:hypothetical protein K3495_g1760 [Podosphaera aphanis]
MTFNATVTIGNQKAVPCMPILVLRMVQSMAGTLRFGLWTPTETTKNLSLPIKAKQSKAKEERNNQFRVQLDNYNDRNDDVHSVLVGVTEELQELACSCDEEPDSTWVAMRLRKEKYDYKTTTSTILLLK